MMTPRSLYQKIFHFDVVRKLRKEIGKQDFVLDLGCGWNSLLQYCQPKYSLGVDSYRHYIELSRNRSIHTEYLESDINDIDFDPDSFDIVFCAQVIEHFPKEEGYELLEKMHKWARRKVILTTPNGFLEKPAFDENERQEHLSGWTVADLRQFGFRVRGSSGLKVIRENCPPSGFWRVLFGTSSAITAPFPERAFQLFAIMETGKAGKRQRHFDHS